MSLTPVKQDLSSFPPGVRNPSVSLLAALDPFWQELARSLLDTE